MIEGLSTVLVPVVGTFSEKESSEERCKQRSCIESFRTSHATVHGSIMHALWPSYNSKKMSMSLLIK
ncbi:hypothetical protein EUGRSUZ_E04310 [Eucalyptus grandis]|uniref:Uncharacterized protein n=2 Tax=Eucalyptus grandis TaxID=71139 RepID=A0ACC3L1S5_EUCGR|nr:hypothetical protein EUGRSUZ_E04310 [Eucalyptus grandis]